MIIGPIHFWPGAFWLVPPVFLILLILRLYRTKRREILAGSLLIWRRLAAQQPKVRPKRIIVDRSLLLQAGTLLLLIAALAGPTLAWGGSRGQRLLLVLDNGSQSRARLPYGGLLWEHVKTAAERMLRNLKAEDRVFLARTEPLLQIMTPKEGMDSAQALGMLATIRPALSRRGANEIWSFAADHARVLSPLPSSLKPQAPSLIRVVSLQADPAGTELNDAWHCVAPRQTALSNVAIVDFGALPILRGENIRELQVLVRLRNFSSEPAQGNVRLEILRSGVNSDMPEKSLTLGAHEEEVAVFDIPWDLKGNPIRISWRKSDGLHDALPEDDVVIAAPRPIANPRIHFHGQAPAVEKLYAATASLVPVGDMSAAEVEVYVRSVPEKWPESSRGIILLSPPVGYRTFFDIGENSLMNAVAQRDENDAITQNIPDPPEGIFSIPQAREIVSTGTFKTLLRDRVSLRPLVMRFADESNRPGFVFAFVPGEAYPERSLPVELAVMLVRMAEEAAGSGDPFVVARAERLESMDGESLPLDWTPGMAKNSPVDGAGVLNEMISELRIGSPATGQSPVSLVAAQGPPPASELDLALPIILLALILMAIEFWLK